MERLRCINCGKELVLKKSVMVEDPDLDTIARNFLDITGAEHVEVHIRNLWLYYNVLTALISHRINSLNKRVRTWDRLRSATKEW